MRAEAGGAKQGDTAGWAWFLPVALLFLALPFVVSPAGNFPLNDDWIYNAAVAHPHDLVPELLRRATSADYYPQRLYGTALAHLIGFSFLHMRLVGFAFGFLSLCLTYAILRRLRFDGPACLAGTATLMASPIFLYLSYSFMTDLPYLVFFLGALLCYVHAAGGAGRLSLLGASLLVILALAQRQIGLALCPAAIAYFFVRRRERPLDALDWVLMLAPLPAFAILTLLQHAGPGGITRLSDVFNLTAWARAYQIHPIGDIQGVSASRARMIQALAAVGVVATLGLMTFPLLIAKLARPIRFLRGLPKRSVPLFMASLGGLLLARGLLLDQTVGTLQVRTMPFLKNVLTPCGVGPGAGEVLVGRCDPILGPTTIGIVTGAALLGGAVLLACALGRLWGAALAMRWRNLTLRAVTPEEGSAGAAGLGLVLLAGASQVPAFFIVWPLDRYLIPLMVPVAILLLDLSRRARLSLAALLIALLPLASYGVAGLQDYFAWNRARWDLARELVAQGVPAENIDGGFEWIAWEIYIKRWNSSVASAQPSIHSRSLLYYPPLLPSLNPKYLISFSEVPDYRVIEERDVPSWLPIKKRRLYVSRYAGG